MVAIPKRILTEPIVLITGTGFDGFGELAYSGQAVVSGSGYLKTTRELTVTAAGIASVDRLEMLSDPEEMTPRPGDKIQAQAKSFRVRHVRPVADRDGVIVVHISEVQELN